MNQGSISHTSLALSLSLSTVWTVAMAKLSSDDIEGEGEMTKRRKTNEGGKTLNIPSSQSKIKEVKTLNPPS